MIIYSTETKLILNSATSIILPLFYLLFDPLPPAIEWVRTKQPLFGYTYISLLFSNNIGTTHPISTFRNGGGGSTVLKKYGAVLVGMLDVSGR